MSETQQGPDWRRGADGKWYPPAPPRQVRPAAPQVVYVQQKPKGGCFRWIGIVVVALIVLGVIGAIIGAVASKSDDKSKADKAATSSGGQDVFALGQTAHSGDFDIKLESVQNPYMPTNQFERPQAGQHFVLVELTVTNTADDQRALSTLVGSEVHDAQNRAWNITFVGSDLPQLDGIVPKGESRRGFVAFAVADDATGLTLRIKGDITSTGSVFALE